MEDIVGLRLAHRMEERELIAQVGVLEEDPLLAIDAVEVVLDIVHRAAPTSDTPDVPVSVLQQEIDQVGSDHAGDPGDGGSFCHGAPCFPQKAS